MTKHLFKQYGDNVTEKLKNLLSVNADAKTSKGASKGYLSGILYMLPNKATCPMASKGCLKGCLQSAGRGNMAPVKKARKEKRELFYEDQEFFMRSLKESIRKLIVKANNKGMVPVVRLNGTSDIAYEEILLDGKNIFEHYPEVQFYDYTPRWDRTAALRGDWSNYHLTFSRKEDNENDALLVNQIYGTNVAVVFDKIPEVWQGRKVINGDETDLRFLDEKNVIVGLTAKGKAKKDTSGFVVRSV
jgi:hypothetical protein